MHRFVLAALAACLASSCVTSILTAPVRAVVDVTGDVARGAVDVATPDGDDKK
jgi:hypothetical protein